MTNRELDQQMAKQISITRSAGKEILRLIVLAQKQKLCGELGYRDLADWLIRGHKMSERSAYRKLKAAKLSQDVPEILDKIESGHLSLTAVTQVQSAIVAHEKFTGEKLSPSQKSAVLDQIQGLKNYDTERKLISLFPEIASAVKQDRTVVVSENISRLSLNLPNETLDLIQRARDLLSHSMPNASQAEIIAFVFSEFLNRKDPLKKPTQRTGTCLRKATIKRATLQRAKAACEFIDHTTGIVCGSTYQVQIDHIQPKALGGTNDPSNLRCLCRRHNLYMSEKNLGKKATSWKNH